MDKGQRETLDVEERRRKERIKTTKEPRMPDLDGGVVDATKHKLGTWDFPSVQASPGVVKVKVRVKVVWSGQGVGPGQITTGGWLAPNAATP
jgi:hypothetical protein